MMQEARPMPADTIEDNRMSVTGGRLDVTGCDVGSGGGGEDDDVVVAVQEEDNDAGGQADACEYE